MVNGMKIKVTICYRKQSFALPCPFYNVPRLMSNNTILSQPNNAALIQVVENIHHIYAQ
jgi:hypothetical protein